jgi:glycosyltransferase involved in cell wall biosynthesis
VGFFCVYALGLGYPKQNAMNSLLPSPVTVEVRAPLTAPVRDKASISCVMPAHNEAKNLPQVVDQVLRTLRTLSERVELIIVDDGSRDATAAVVEQLCAQYPELVLLQLSRNFGKESAITAGLASAAGEVVVIMDSDGQHPVDLLPKMFDLWRQGLDVVYATRTTRDDQTALHGRLVQLFYTLVNSGNRVKIPPNAGDFRLMDHQVVKALNALPERNRFMKGLYAWAGFKSTAIEYEPLPRLEGVSRFGWRSSIGLAVTGVVAFSTVPLRFLSFLGLILALAAFFYGGWVVVEYFYLGIQVSGYATIVVGMMLLSGIQLMGMGILAEYVGRIYEEVKQRPVFWVQKRVGLGLAGPAQPDKLPGA